MLLFLVFCVAAVVSGRERKTNVDNLLLNRIFDNGDSLLQSRNDTSLYIYHNFRIDIKKRNFILKLLPSMYPIARGRREYKGERLFRLIMSNGKIQDLRSVRSGGNVPRNKDVVSLMKVLLQPRIYDATIFDRFLLSPFERTNRSFYKYKTERNKTTGLMRVMFRPRFKNIQLVAGSANVDSTGYIHEVEFRGTIDVMKFSIRILMQKDHPPMPHSSNVRTKMRFMGNKVVSAYNVLYHLDSHAIDTLIAASRQNGFPFDSTTTRRSRRESSFWKDMGSYLIDRLGGNFGGSMRGSFKMSPIINPLYLGYSSYKGVTYRIKLNGNLDFNSDARLSMGARLGYSFKLRQVYFNIPMRLTLGKRMAIETEYGTGNHIFNSEILTQLKHESYDSIRWENLRHDLFKDMFWRFRTGFLISPRLRLSAGFAYHRRTAVDPHDFAITGRKPKYHSFSPTLQLVWSPWHNRGPVLTYDYERGIKGVMHSDMNYERMEIDVSWKIPIMKLRVLSMKIGYGMYTSRSKGAYFLDYRNFKYNSISDGWNDDWTGEFQLLNKNWYNASKYYVNSNLTYESPLLLVSRIPFVGKFIETERLYCNTLFTDKLHPYLECGYGLTNRLFSMGLFLGVSNKHFEGTGIRMSMELFRDW